MNRRTVVTAAALAPLAAASQPIVETNIAMVRNVIEDGLAREAALYDKLLEVWEWLDIWGDMLPDGAKADLLKSLGPDPGVRISR